MMMISIIIIIIMHWSSEEQLLHVPDNSIKYTVNINDTDCTVRITQH